MRKLFGDYRVALDTAVIVAVIVGIRRLLFAMGCRSARSRRASWPEACS